MDETDNKKHGTATVLAMIAIFGLATYLVAVMPFRIIWRGKGNSFFSTLMPFSNIFSIQAVTALGFYGYASLIWTIIIMNTWHREPNFTGTYYMLLVIALVTTPFVAWIALKDIKDSAE